jgi:hypothetical protein
VQSPDTAEAASDETVPPLVHICTRRPAAAVSRATGPSVTQALTTAPPTSNESHPAPRHASHKCMEHHEVTPRASAKRRRASDAESGDDHSCSCDDGASDVGAAAAEAPLFTPAKKRGRKAITLGPRAPGGGRRSKTSAQSATSVCASVRSKSVTRSSSSAAPIQPKLTKEAALLHRAAKAAQDAVSKASRENDRLAQRKAGFLPSPDTDPFYDETLTLDQREHYYDRADRDAVS